LKGSPEPRKLSGLIFSREIRPEKNREIFRILQSHNMLSERWLQKQSETSIYSGAEFGQAESSFGVPLTNLLAGKRDKDKVALAPARRLKAKNFACGRYPS
jgi:hypothetical protein